MRARSRLFLSIVLGCSAHGACGSDGGTASDGGPDVTGDVADTTADTGATDASAETTASCDPPGFGGGEQAVTVGAVTATLVDEQGQPIPNLFAGVTGIDLTFQGTSNALGVVSINADHAAKKPAFRYGDGRTYGEIAFLIGAGAGDLGQVVTPRLPTDGPALTPGSDATSGGLTLHIAAGASVLVDELTYPTAADQQFRAARVPNLMIAKIAIRPPNDLVYAVGPFDTIVCPRVGVTVANEDAWPAGAAVEVWILGLDVGQQWAPWGEWAKVADATVSADGATISTNPGSGLPVLTTLGFRLVQ